MGNTQDNLFFKCIECKQNLCILCKSGHNPNHNIINYWNKYYICEEHGEAFISYCYNCNCNLCFICEQKHNNHKIKSFKNMFIDDKNKSNGELDNFKENIKTLKELINNFINICNKVVESYEILYNIKKEIYDNINFKQRNFQSWYNQKFIINQINDDIKGIINEINYDNNFSKILKIYEQIEFKKKIKNDLLIRYKIKENEKNLKIFHQKFVENNKNHCKIIYDNIENELSEYINIDNVKNIKNNIVEIKLTGIENITNANCMFFKCTSLISVPDISEWNTKNITNMSCMFSGCSSLISLPDISNWKTGNVTTFNCMFSRCSSLISLPNISKWNTNSLINLGYIFRGCSSLTSIPDISKWNVSNVTNFDSMFSGCSSLKSLPDLSKWNINKDYSTMNNMFEDCPPSLIIPEQFKK